MIANTKQIRQVINQAFKNVGESKNLTWTDRIQSTPALRNRMVCYEVSDSVAIAHEAQRLAKRLKYDNIIIPYVGYVRVVAPLA